ncbi:MFS transporter [Paraburkholderia sediminicola]|nr:MFS transporter [Paraburkholderia sediminicola]
MHNQDSTTTLIDSLRPSSSSEWSNGWRTLLGGFLAMSTGWNVVSISLSVFLKPMQAAFGWSRTELSIAPIASLLTALLLPVTGLLLDRFGPRKVAIAGTLAMGVTLGLFAALPLNGTIFAVLVVLLAVAGSTINSFVLSRGVASVFQRNLGTAVGVLLSGVSVAVAVLIPFIVSRISANGWRSGFAALSTLALLFSLPALLLLFREPSRVSAGHLQSQMLVRDSFRTIFSSIRFWQLTAACFLASLPIGGAINHLVPLLSDRGLPSEQFAALGSAFAVAIGVSGLVNGALFDRLHPPIVTAVTLTLAGLGSGLLYFLPMHSESFGRLVLCVALIGFAPGAEGPYITYFSNRLFGLRNFSRVVSFMALTISVGMALGGLVFSAIFDRFRDYGPAIIGSIALYLLAAGVFLSIKLPPRDAWGGTNR